MRTAWLIIPSAYLLGAIPFGYILARIAAGTDIRKVGSGNIGATNVFRKSRWAGIITLGLDAGKGYLAVAAAGWLGFGPEWQGAAAVTAILGHIFTVFLRFKGGKGVATGCGAFLALSPSAVGSTLLVFLATVIFTRYISLASIVATAAFPVLCYLHREPLAVLIGAALGALVIVVRHHQNIRRLISGTEPKFAFGSRPG